MFVQREPGEVRTWFVAFHTTTSRWWVRYVVPGRYKHVCVFGYSHACRTWLFLDVNLANVRVFLLPEGKASEDELARLTYDASILHMPAIPREGAIWRSGFGCVVAVKHLLGLRGGALRPDALWRLMLREGARVVHEFRPANARARPDAASPAAAGASRATSDNPAGRLV